MVGKSVIAECELQRTRAIALGGLNIIATDFYIDLLCHAIALRLSARVIESPRDK